MLRLPTDDERAQGMRLTRTVCCSFGHALGDTCVAPVRPQCGLRCARGSRVSRKRGSGGSVLRGP